MLKAASKKKKKRIDTYNALQFESNQVRRCKAAWPYAVYYQIQALNHHPSE